MKRGDYNWVYVTEDEQHSYRVCIVHSLDGFGQSKGVVYYRFFNDILVALGYRLILERLSRASLERIILKQNPILTDLSDEMNNEIRTCGIC